MRRLLLATVATLGLLVLTACSDEEAPDWLVAEAAPSTTTTTTPALTTLPPTTTGEPGQDVAAIDLAPGMCVEDASALTGRQVNEITEIRTVPCRLPHGAEVYARDELAGGPDAAFPGVGALRNQAQQTCRDSFEGFVGVRWTQSELEISALWPSPPSWATGDRAVVCAVFHLDGEPLTGSARGSAL
jgi:Septum formation